MFMTMKSLKEIHPGMSMDWPKSVCSDNEYDRQSAILNQIKIQIYVSMPDLCVYDYDKFEGTPSRHVQVRTTKCLFWQQIWLPVGHLESN